MTNPQNCNYIADAKTSNKLLWLFMGFVISILTIFIQHIFTKREKTIQLYLDEKKDFLASCDIYVKEYRQWHELMNYFIYYDSTRSDKDLLEFSKYSDAVYAYRAWKKDFDFAYGKIFLLSDNEFGLKTLMVSTVLHSTIDSVIYNNYSVSQGEKMLQDVETYFFENWLLPAQEEIFRYNSGERKQKSINEFIVEQQQLKRKQIENDSIDKSMYEGLMRIYRHIQKQDSLSGNHSMNGLTTTEDFEDFLAPDN